MHEPEKPKWNAGDMDKWPGNEQSTIKRNLLTKSVTWYPVSNIGERKKKQKDICSPMA